LNSRDIDGTAPKFEKLKPKPYDLMDYSDVSSKRQRFGPASNRALIGAPLSGNPFEQANILKNYGEYLGLGSSLVNQNQHLFLPQVASQSVILNQAQQ